MRTWKNDSIRVSLSLQPVLLLAGLTLILPLFSAGQRLYDEIWERFSTAP